MIKRTRTTIQILVVLFSSLLAACVAAPVAPQPTALSPAPSPMATATRTPEPSATVQPTATSTRTPTASPTATNVPTATAQPTPTATSAPTATSTPEPPAVTLTANANLRSGPGTAYPVLRGGRQGQVLAVLAQYHGWWQTPLGWVSGSLAQANAAAAQPGRVPELKTVAAPPPTSTPQPQPTGTPVLPAQAAPVPSAVAEAPAGVPYQDVVVLGPDTVYPVRARVVQGWGYELVDASTQYDWLIKRDVFGAVAHQVWGDRLCTASIPTGSASR